MRPAWTPKSTGPGGRLALPRDVVDSAKVLEYRPNSLGSVTRPVLRPGAVHSIVERRPAGAARDGCLQDVAAKGSQENEFTRGKPVMSLLIVYLALMIAGDVIAYLIGLVIERTVPGASLPAFLAMYFLFLWIAWIIAVRITEPRKAATA
jgi:hypothetical protein